jgi:hypothetical protein
MTDVEALKPGERLQVSSCVVGGAGIGGVGRERW